MDTIDFDIGAQLAKEDDERRRFKEALIDRQSADIDPKRQSEALRVSKDKNLPVDLVERNLEDYTKPKFDFDYLREESPQLYDFITKQPDKAAIVRHDVENMSSIERVWGNLKQSYVLGWDGIEMGEIRARQMDNGGVWGSPEDEARLNELKKIQGAAIPYYEMYDAGNSPGIVAQLLPSFVTPVIEAWDETLVGAGAGAAFGIPGLVAGAAAGFNVGTIKGIYDMQRGEIYGEARETLDEEGVPLDHDTSWMVATAGGALGTVMERIGFKAIAKAFPGLDKLASFGAKELIQMASKNPVARKHIGRIGKIIQAGATESLTELGQSIVALEGIMLAGGVTDENGNKLADSRWERYPEAAYIGLIGGGGLAAGGQAGKPVADKVGQKAKELAEPIVQSWVHVKAKAKAKSLRDIGEKISSSKIAEMSPETVEAFADVLDESSQVELTVSADAVRKLFQEEGYTGEQLELLFPEITTQLADADATGAEIDLSAKSFVKMGKMAGFSEFVSDIRAAANERTEREALELELQVEAVRAEVEADPEAPLPTSTLQPQIEEQLLQSGHPIYSDPEVAKRNSHILAAAINNLSEESGVDPQELAARHELTVESEAQGGIISDDDIRLTQDQELANDLLNAPGESRMVGKETPILDTPDLKVSESDMMLSNGKRSLRYVQYEDGQPIAVLQFMTEGGRSKKAVIQNIFVVEDKRRQKVAANLLRRAQEDYDIKHSNDLTTDGRGFAEADGTYYQDGSINTESQEFKDFIEGSAIVEPIFHGTGVDADTIEQFEHSKAQDGHGRSVGLGLGRGKFYLSREEQVARNYSLMRGADTPQVIEAYVSIKKPMNVKEYHERYRNLTGREIAQPYDMDFEMVDRDAAIAQIDDDIRNEGYDGIIDDLGQVAVFSSSQIKSVNNRGTWDPNDDRIMYQGGAINTESQAFKDFIEDSQAQDPVYHGTFGSDFDAFKPGTWFSTHPAEASAYAETSDIATKNKGTGKYTTKSGADLAGQRLPYSGIMGDTAKVVGEFYATDNGVVEYLGKGKWALMTDVVVEYGTSDPDAQTILVKAGDATAQANRTIEEHENFLDENFSKGEGGRVYPAYISVKNPKRMEALEANRIAKRMGMSDPEIQAEIDALKAEGYDSIVTSSDEATMFPDVASDLGGIPDQYLIFEPGQAKSVNNRGTWDRNDDRVLHQDDDWNNPIDLSPAEEAMVNPIYTGGIPVGAARGNKGVAAFLEDRFEGEPITDFTAEIPDARLRSIGRVMASEAAHGLRKVGNAGDWYSGAMQRFLDVASIKWPMLTNDAAAKQHGFGTASNARFAFTYIMAVTSQNLDVAANSVATNKAFDEMIERVQNGDYTMDAWGTGDKQKAMNTNFAKFGPLIDAMPGEAFEEKLTALDAVFRQKKTVSEWEVSMKAAGIPFNAPGQTAVDAEVYGSALLGPKIGNGFWQNLNGNFDPLTIDLWKRRTWGRLTGKSIGNESALPAQRARMKASAKRSLRSPENDKAALREVNKQIRALNRVQTALDKNTDMKKKDRDAAQRRIKADRELLEEIKADAVGIPVPEGWKKIYDTDDKALAAYALRLNSAWTKQYKLLVEKHGKGNVPDEAQPTWAFAAKRLKANLTTPLDQVGNGTQRKQIEKAVAYALDNLRAAGYDLTTADLQATLWYPEKELWNAIRSRLAQDNDGNVIIPPSPLNESYDDTFRKIIKEEGYEIPGQDIGGDGAGGSGRGAVAGQDGGLDGSQGAGRTGEARDNDHGGKPGQTESTDEEVTFYQDGPSDGPFYSGTLRAVEGLNQPKAPPAQWMATIKKQPGVKPDELEFLGLEEWLGKQGKSVTKEELIGYIQANELRLEETTLGDELPSEIESYTEVDSIETNEFGASDFVVTFNNGRQAWVWWHDLPSVEAWPAAEEVAGRDLASLQDRFGLVIGSVAKAKYLGIDWVVDHYGSPEKQLILSSEDGAAASFPLDNLNNYTFANAIDTFAVDLQRAERITASASGEAKFENYSTLKEMPHAGGKNYREVLIQMPDGVDRGKVGEALVGPFPGQPDAIEDILGNIAAEGLEHLDYGRTDDADGNEVIVFNNVPGLTWAKVEETINVSLRYTEARLSPPITITGDTRPRTESDPEGFENAVREAVRKSVIDGMDEVTRERAETITNNMVDRMDLRQLETYLSNNDQGEVLDALVKEFLALTEPDQPPFVSGHWDQPNVVAHVRTSEYTAPDGSRVLVLEELQSDWHQNGRKRGYVKPVDGSKIAKERKRLQAKLDAVQESITSLKPDLKSMILRHEYFGGDTVVPAFRKFRSVEEPEVEFQTEADRSLAREFYDLHQQRFALEGEIDSLSAAEAPGWTQVGGEPVPDAPFKTSWTELGFKRVLHEAAVKGFDRIAWSPGEVHAKRYGLEKTVESIEVEFGGSSAPDGSRTVRVFPIGPGVYSFHERHGMLLVVDEEGRVIDAGTGAGQFKGQLLDDVLGVEMAKKIMAVKNTKSSIRTFSGLDLKVGGEGMKAFYDKMLPSMVNKLVKKWGGRVSTSVLAEDPKAEIWLRSSIVWSLDINDKIKSAAESGLPLFQKGEKQTKRKGPRGFIQFGKLRDKFKITLTGRANLSTFVHESWHMIAEIMLDLEARGEASQRQIDDLNRMRKYVGAKEGQVGFTRKQHEKIARSGEAYLMEGRAPSLELRDTFSRFKAWMTFVYKKMSNLDVELDDEIRGVFDRILASDKAIAEARTEIGQETAPLSQDALALTDAEYKSYQEAWTKAREKERAAVESRLMLDAASELKRAWDIEVKKVTKRLADDVEETVGYKAWKALLDGDIKIARGSIPEEYRKLAFGLTTEEEDGIPLDALAGQLGYDIGIEMLQDMHQARSAHRAARQQAVAMVKQAHGHLNPKTLSDVALRAVHDDETLDVMFSEFRAMAEKADIKVHKGLGDRLRRIAEERVAVLTGRQLQPGKWHRAEIKAAKAAATAMAKGDHMAAALAKRQQLMSAAMYRATADAKQKMETRRKTVRPFQGNKRRSILGKAGDVYLDGIDELLEGVNLKKTSARSVQKANRLANLVKEAEEAGQPLILPEKLLASLGKVAFDDMTMDDQQALVDSVINIWHLAKLKNKLKDGRNKRDLEETLDEMAVVADKEIKKDVRGPTNLKGNNREIGERARDLINRGRASLVKTEFLFQWLDGQITGGLMHRLIFQPLVYAGKREYEIMRGFNETLLEPLRNMPEEQRVRWDTKLRFMGELGNGATIIMAALNTGNKGNRKKLLEGRGWDEATFQAELDAFMTKADWDMVQLILHEVNTLLPEIQRVSKLATGLPAAEVKAEPIITPFGTYEGGYFPVVYDPDLNEKQYRNQESAEGLFTNNYVKPKLGDGFTEARTGYVGPILLDFSVLSSHLSQVVHYVTHYEAIEQANKIIEHPKFDAIISRKFGKQFYRQLRPWLQDVARDQDTPAITKHEAASSIMKHFRGGVSVASMGYNPFTAAKQPLGLTTALDAISPRYWVQGMSKTFVPGSGMVDNWKFALESSAELEKLIKDFNRDVKMVNDAYAKKVGGTAGEAVMRNSFTMIGMTQLVVNVATWQGAYDEALIREDLSHQEAVDRADAIVRTTQSSGAVKDLAPIQRGSEMSRAVSMFYSWFSVLYNRIEDIARKTNSIKDVPMVARRVAVLLFLTALMEETSRVAYDQMKEALGYEDEDEDEDDDFGFILTVLMKGIDTGLAAIPLVRSFVSVESTFTPKLTPIAGLPKNAARVYGTISKAVQGEAPTRSEAKNVARTVSTVTKVPLYGGYRLIDEFLGEKIFDE